MTPCSLTGKRSMTRKQALAEARWWRQTMFARMRHYRCGACGQWHIGNDRRKGRRRAA